MKDVFIRVNIDSAQTYTSERLDIAGKSQEVIYIQIPNKLYHPKYEFNYTRSGESNSFDYSDISERIPFTQSFMIEQFMDTAWISTFYVNQGELNAIEKDRFYLNFDIGNTYFNNNNYDSALIYYKHAMWIDPTSPDLNFNLSILNSELHQYNRALTHLEIAMDYAGPKWEYLNSKSYILRELGKCQYAVSAGLEALNLNPDNIKIYGNLVQCFDKLQNGDSVLKYLTMVEQKFGTPPDWMSEIKNKYSN